MNQYVCRGASASETQNRPERLGGVAVEYVFGGVGVFAKGMDVVTSEETPKVALKATFLKKKITKFKKIVALSYN